MILALIVSDDLLLWLDFPWCSGAGSGAAGGAFSGGEAEEDAAYSCVAPKEGVMAAAWGPLPRRGS